MVEITLTIIIILYSLLALTGLIGNIWVMTTVISQLVGCCMSPSFHTRRRTPIVGVQSSACLYLLLLSVVDMMSLLPVPFIISDLTNSKFNYENWLCKLVFSCEGANKSLSPFVLTALSVDRYIAVCKPTYVWMRQARFAFGIIILCFCLSLCFILPVTLLSGVVVIPHNNKTYVKCSVDMPRTFTLLLFLICYIMPLIFICLVYIAILRRLYKHTHLSTVGRRTSISLSRVVKCSVLVVMFYFICWTPWMIFNMYLQFFVSPPDYGDEYEEGNELSEHQAQFQEMFNYLVHALPYTQSAFNWLFYAFLNHNLRHSSRCPLGTRSNATNIGGDNYPTSATGSMVPLWKNIQSVGSYLKTASIDTGNTLLRHSPFRSRSRIRSRSTTCLGSIIDTPTPAPVSNGFLSITGDGSTFYTSMVDLPLIEPLRCDSSNNTSHAKLGNSRSACALQSNSFSPKPTPDFPLLGFPPARSSSPIRLSAPTSLRVPSLLNSPWSISEASSSSINIGMSTPSTAPISPQDGLNPTIDTNTSTDERCKDVTVIAFIIYPAKANSFNIDSLRGQAVCKQLKETISNIKEKIGERMFEACVRGHIPSMEELVHPSELVQLKRCILSSKRDALPPICTHNMVDDGSDPVLNAFRRTHLFNNNHDRVKVVFHPEFLSSVSPLIGLDYEDFVRGCHLGVFPSYYEPWGYTPAECTVMGVPSVTTNLSGFGNFIEKYVDQHDNYGIFIVDRRFKSASESCDQLAECLFKYSCLSRRQRVILRNRTERLSDLLDWKALGTYYREARRLALKKVYPDLELKLSDSVKKIGRPVSAVSTPNHSRPGSPHGSESDTSEQEERENIEFNS